MRQLARRIISHGRPASLLCRSCGQARRQFASSASPPAPPTSGLVALSSRKLISVSGPDAGKFLQGIVTANVTPSKGGPREEGFYSAFLTATGRVLHDVFIYPVSAGTRGAAEGDGFLIEVDADQAKRLEKIIKRYKLRANVVVRGVNPDEANVWHAWDDSQSSQLNVAADDSRLAIKDPRVPGLGYRIIQYGNGRPEIDLDTTDETGYTIRRYLMGVPEGQDEILREHSLPLESNIEYMNGIDFHKGCYVGQELTIRTKHRGVVRKRILPCVVYPKDKPAPQTLAYHAGEATDASPEAITADMIPAETSIGRSGKRGRSAGKWLKGIGNIGLGICRLEIMTDVVLPGEQAAATFSEGDEFVLEWGEEGVKEGVKVKAFVPDWLRAGMEASKR